MHEDISWWSSAFFKVFHKAKTRYLDDISGCLFWMDGVVGLFSACSVLSWIQRVFNSKIQYFTDQWMQHTLVSVVHSSCKRVRVNKTFNRSARESETGYWMVQQICSFSFLQSLEFVSGNLLRINIIIVGYCKDKDVWYATDRCCSQ